MLVFGHPKIPCPRFRFVAHTDAIAQIPSNHLIFFYAHGPQAFELSKHCSDHNAKYAVCVQNLLELVLMANFKPAFLLVEDSPKEYQSVADDYLLDARILWIIHRQEEMQEALRMRVDGVIFKQALEF